MLRLSCTCSSVRPLLARSIHAPASVVPSSRIPKPRAPFDNVESILKASGRGLDQYSEKLQDSSFANLFQKTSTELRDQVGMTVKESKYFLRVLEKYRQGFNPDQVAISEKPKKTIRGWGPRVQNGVRVR